MGTWVGNRELLEKDFSYGRVQCILFKFDLLHKLFQNYSNYASFTHNKHIELPQTFSIITTATKKRTQHRLWVGIELLEMISATNNLNAD